MWARQESVTVLLLEAKSLKDPAAHVRHWGWAVTEPAVFVYLPGGHLVWAIQESVAMLLLDAEALKNPVMHVSQVGSVELLPAVFVNLPGGHLLVWAVHHSKGQPVANVRTT